MATILPTLIYPAYTQGGQSSQRTSGVFFLGSSVFTQILPLPKTLTPNQSIETDPILVVGFNTFLALIDALTNNIELRLNHKDPLAGTQLFFRSMGTATAGGGFPLGIMLCGYGNAVASGGSDVFHTISLTFRNTSAVANAVINQFPGFWGAAR